MRRAVLAITIIIGAALPAAADPIACTKVTIDHTHGAQITSVDYQKGAPLTSINGPYLNVSWTDSTTLADNGWVDTLSFDVSSNDVESATACSDGSVTIHTSTPEPDPDQDFRPETPSGGEAPAQTPPTPTSLAPICTVHPDTLTHYCTLPNLNLTIT